MADTNHCDGHKSLGAGASDAIQDLSAAEEQRAARRALETLAVALGEDTALAPADPGLPEDYEVLGILGRGSGGVVYRARQHSLARDVAVKVLLHSGDPRTDLKRSGEAKRLAGLQHEGIVRIHEVGEARSGLFLTLELHRAGSLQARLEDGPLNPRLAARLTQQVAEAVAYMHGRGVVHLDLKPANVLIDDDGDARVADFGLARDADLRHSLSGTGGLLGTPAYMAPEQARNDREAIGEASDVHGLGALLFACLAGRAPFEGESLVSILTAVQNTAPPRIDRVAMGVPAALADVVEVALAKDPVERYPSAMALAADLARFAEGEPTHARPPGPWARALRMVRARRRELISAVGAMLLTAVALVPYGEDLDRVEGERWLGAAEDLMRDGEPRAAALLSARVRDDAPADLLRRRDAMMASLDTPGGNAGERAKVAAGAPVDVVDAVVDVWILPDGGPPRRLHGGTAEAAAGELLRVEGRGVLGGKFPGRMAKFDFLATAGPSSRWLNRRDGIIEAGGIVRPLEGGGLLWDITDCEVWVSLGSGSQGAFLDMASEGLMVGAPCMLEARRCIWRGGSATLVMMAEARVRTGDSPAPTKRSLGAWIDAIKASFSSRVDELAETEVPTPLDAVHRALLVDQAIALISLGGKPQRSAVIDAAHRLEAAGIDPQSLSAGLLPEQPQAHVTRTGAGLGVWLDFAAEDAPMPIGERMDSLPPPNSMRPSEPGARVPLDWLRILYIVVALGVTTLAALPVTPVFFRASAAAGALLPAGLAVGAWLDRSGYEYLWAGSGCICLAIATWVLRRWSRWKGSAGAALFLIAGIQFLLLESLGIPDLRIPLALGFACLAASVADLHPDGRGTHFARWVPVALISSYGVLVGFALPEPAEEAGPRVMASLVFATLFAATWAGSRRATVLQQEAQVAEART